VTNGKLHTSPELEVALRAGAESWDNLMFDPSGVGSVVEYIDPAEQEQAYIALWPSEVTANSRHTHCEIHPSTIFGVIASCVPYPDHNQSPRNTYQCAMGKQAMGVYATNFQNRMDKTGYILAYPMRPLVDTRVMNMLRLNSVPSGEMLIVGIATYGGFNQEDSIMFNQGFIERGGAAATVYKTEKDEDKKASGEEEVRCAADPARTRGMKFANYGKLNHSGVVPENTLLHNKDVIIGKVIPIREARTDHHQVMKFQDHSKVFRTREECYVDRNVQQTNADGYAFCKVRTRAFRQPEIGDKFSSRHGQKGTIGIILPEEDMPFNAEGIRPDILINPHAIPSRMTIGQLKETLLGKVLLDLGLFGDGTSFGSMGIEEIRAQLTKLGYESTGNEVLTNGMTGEQMETSIFVGPVFYQRLKHMVRDKEHSRGSGPMVTLTHQPAEGRSREGGLRFGEMERDCMVSHGASRFTKERVYDVSDKYQVHVCKECGMIAAHNDEAGIHHCRACDNRSSFSRVEIPYACKLLFQELTTMSIAPRIVAP
jgi:DNA-directed RNA polymerase II subunit RPB2